MRLVRIQLGAGSVPLAMSLAAIGRPCSGCGRDVTASAMKSPKLSAAVSASTGRRFAADKSVNGNGTSSRSPRSGIVPDFVLGAVPHRRQRLGLGVHQIAPFGAV